MPGTLGLDMASAGLWVSKQKGSNCGCSGDKGSAAAQLLGLERTSGVLACIHHGCRGLRDWSWAEGTALSPASGCHRAWGKGAEPRQPRAYNRSRGLQGKGGAEGPRENHEL